MNAHHDAGTSPGTENPGRGEDELSHLTSANPTWKTPEDVSPDGSSVSASDDSLVLPTGFPASPGHPPSQAPSASGVRSALDHAFDDLDAHLVSLRRDIHAHPEVAWQEHRTTSLIRNELTQAGLAPIVLPTGTGLVCDVPGSANGPVVGLRADMDALPLPDEKTVSYRSTYSGVCHACGHDVHSVIVLGAGLALSRLSRRGELPAPVRLIFQPAEEVVPGGALAVLETGLVENMQQIFAFHCDPTLDAGHVGLRVGSVTAATDALTVTVRGSGGHTSRPHLTVDVVSALADVIARTPAVLSRRVDPRAVLSLVWGQVSAGSALNVIPETGQASGSVRILDLETWERAGPLVDRVVREIVAPYGAEVEVSYVSGVPPAVNDTPSTHIFQTAACAVVGPDAVHDTPQSMGGEDFAWFLRRIPGALGRIGVRRRGATGTTDLHRGDFDVDEAAIGWGSRILAKAALLAGSQTGS